MPRARSSVLMQTYSRTEGARSYQLIYFNGQGRAEVARYLFALARVPYEDIRVPAEQWPQLRKDMPFGQLPVLRVDGQQYCRSEAIFRFLAREFGFYGKSDEEGALIDMIVGRILAVFNEIVPIWQLLHGDRRVRCWFRFRKRLGDWCRRAAKEEMEEEEEEEKEKEEEEEDCEVLRIVRESVPPLIAFLDSHLPPQRSWLVGDSVSLADVVAYMFFTAPITAEFVGKKWRKRSGGVSALVCRVAALPDISAYVSERLPTPF